MLTQRDVLSSMNISITDKVKIPGYKNEVFTCKWRPLVGFVFISKNQEISLPCLTLSQIQGIKLIEKILLKDVKCQHMECCNCPLRSMRCESSPDMNETLGQIYNRNLSYNSKFIRKDVLLTLKAVLEQEYEEGIDYEKTLFCE